MKRRDFLKAAGFMGAAAIVSPAITAKRLYGMEEPSFMESHYDMESGLYFSVLRNPGPSREVRYDIGGQGTRTHLVRGNSRVGVYEMLPAGLNSPEARVISARDSEISSVPPSQARDVLRNTVGCHVHMADGSNPWQFAAGSTLYEFDGAVNRALTEGGITTYLKSPLLTLVPQTAAMNVENDLSPVDRSQWASVGNFYEFKDAATFPDIGSFGLAAEAWWNPYIVTCSTTGVPEGRGRSWGMVKELFRD